MSIDAYSLTMVNPLMARHKAKNSNRADRLTVTLAPGQRETLETIARENQASLAFITRQVLAKFIKDNQDGRLQLLFTPLSSDERS